MPTATAPTSRAQSQWIDLEEYFGTVSGRFCLNMTGSAFDPVGIYEHDTLVVRPARQAENDDLVVIQLPNEKSPRVRRYHERNNGMIELSAPAHQPFILMRSEFHLVGVVVGLMRKF